MPIDPGSASAEVVCRVPAQATHAPKDLVRRVPADVVELALRTPVGAVVTNDVLAVRPDVTVATARDVARGAPLGALVVVDEASRPTGLVTSGTLFDDRVDAAALVAAIATPFAAEIRDETALVHALAGLVGDGEGASLPIVDDEGALLALLRPVDVVRWLAERAGYAL